MTIKIALSGIHGNGKTTLCGKMRSVFESSGKSVYLVKESARECPFPISENTSVEAQKWIWEEHIKEENCGHESDCNIIICDRTLLDNLIYYKYLLKNNPDPVFEALTDYTQKWMKTYDYISVLPMNPEFIVNDGVRITDINKTIEINELFIKYLKPYENIDINRFNYKEVIRSFILRV